MSLLRHQSTSLHNQSDQYRRLDRIRRNDPGLFSPLLDRSPHERGSPNLLAVPGQTELIATRGECYNARQLK